MRALRLGKRKSAGILPEYGRKKLLMYADSFEKLSEGFLPGLEWNFSAEEGLEAKALAENNQDEPAPETDRENLLRRRQEQESRRLLSEHLQEMAGILRKISGESGQVLAPRPRDLDAITTELSRNGIRLARLGVIQLESGRMEIAATMRAMARKPGETLFSVRDIAGLLSVHYRVRLIPACTSPEYLHEKNDTILFEEEPEYYVLTGTARAVKEGEEVSGDNYCFRELGGGRFLCALSDGMGSGEAAFEGSRQTIELFEELLTAGFSMDAAVRLVNGSMLERCDLESLSTLDVCCLDLYHAKARFVKYGAVASYCKSGSEVREIAGGSEPLGITQTLPTRLQTVSLLDGDYLIMMTDGVEECFELAQSGESICDILSALAGRSPEEMASNILHQALLLSGGRIRDDMTVSVIGIWHR